MDWLKAVLPTVATGLGGPLAGMVASFVAQKFGMSEKTIDAVKATIAGATPEQMVRFREIDAELQKWSGSMGIDFEKIAAADRESARSMQVTTRSMVPAALSIAVTAGYFAILIGMMTGSLRVSDSQALLLMLGSLSTAWGVVMAFWFGTTNGSGRKTELLAQADSVKR